MSSSMMIDAQPGIYRYFPRITVRAIIEVLESARDSFVRHNDHARLMMIKAYLGRANSIIETDDIVWPLIVGKGGYLWKELHDLQNLAESYRVRHVENFAPAIKVLLRLTPRFERNNITTDQRGIVIGPRRSDYPEDLSNNLPVHHPRVIEYFNMLHADLLQRKEALRKVYLCDSEVIKQGAKTVDLPLAESANGASIMRTQAEIFSSSDSFGFDHAFTPPSSSKAARSRQDHSLKRTPESSSSKNKVEDRGAALSQTSSALLKSRHSDKGPIMRVSYETSITGSKMSSAIDDGLFGFGMASPDPCAHNSKLDFVPASQASSERQSRNMKYMGTIGRCDGSVVASSWFQDMRTTLDYFGHGNEYNYDQASANRSSNLRASYAPPYERHSPGGLSLDKVGPVRGSNIDSKDSSVEAPHTAASKACSWGCWDGCDSCRSSIKESNQRENPKNDWSFCKTSCIINKHEDGCLRHQDACNSLHLDISPADSASNVNNTPAELLSAPYVPCLGQEGSPMLQPVRERTSTPNVMMRGIMQWPDIGGWEQTPPKTEIKADANNWKNGQSEVGGSGSASAKGKDESRHCDKPSGTNWRSADCFAHADSGKATDCMTSHASHTPAAANVRNKQSEDLKITYWATLESSDAKINLPLHACDVRGKEKQATQVAKKLWRFMAKKDLDIHTSLQEIFELAMETVNGGHESVGGYSCW